MSVRTLAALIALVALVVVVRGVAVGIDFGSSSYKAVLVQNKFRLILNDQSGRKTSTAIAFRNGQRTFASAADNVARFQPDITLSYLRNLLGQEHLSQPRAEAVEQYAFYASRLVEQQTGNFSSLAVKLDDGKEISVHELVAMVLEQCRVMVEKDAGTAVPDAAITVPIYWTQRERQALLEAAELAGFNVLSLINEPTAYALHYATDFGSEFSEPRIVIFVDLGESALQLAAFKYDLTLNKQNKNITQVTLLGAVWDETISGREFDRSLVQHFVNKAKEDGYDISSNKRALFRLGSQIHKSKEVLSANKETQFTIDSLVEDYDLRAHITRAEFEALNAPLYERLNAKLDELFRVSNLTKNDVHNVELVGGSCRVPRFQEELKQYFGREQLDFHVNGDEGAVFGAAYWAASLSTQHKVKEVKLKDATSWRVSVAVTESDGAIIPEGEERIDRTAALFRPGNRYGTKKTISFHTPRDFEMAVYYNVSDEEQQLPLGTPTFIEQLQFEGVSAAVKSHQLATQPKVHVQFRLSTSGVIEILDAKVELQVQERVQKEKKREEEKEDVPKEKDEAQIPAKEAEEEKEEVKDVPAVEYVWEDVVTVKSLPLKITRSGRATYPLSLRSSALKLLAEYAEEDRLRTLTENAKNDLETLIYRTRDDLENAEFIQHSTDQERNSLSESLSNIRDWLEDEGENAKLSDYVEKKSSLTSLISPIKFRITERENLPVIVAQCHQSINMTRTLLENITIAQEVTEEEVAQILQRAQDLETWTEAKLLEQQQLALHEDPQTTSEDITSRCEPLIKETLKLLRRPRRKPKVEEEPKEAKEAKEPQEPQEPKESQEPNEPQEPKEPNEPQEEKKEDL